MRIQIKRRGGLAGVTLRADLVTADLDPDTAARVETAIGSLFEKAPTATPPRPDMLEYEIHAPARGESVVVAEDDLPDELRPLVEMLSKVGTIERAQRTTEQTR